MACGGDDDAPIAATPSATSTQPAPASDEPDRADFLAELNALCRTGNERIRAINEDIDRGDRSAIGRAADAYDVLLPRVEAIEPSSEQAATYERYTTSVRRSAGLVSRLEDAVQDRDAPAIAHLSTALEETAESRLAAAVDLGADDCGR